MSLWLARRLPGGSDAATGMNKGGTFAFGEISVTMTGADHSAGDWIPAARRRSTWASPPDSSSGSRTATRSTTPATRTSSVTCA